LAAVTAVDGLATTLLDAEAITVFAPTNAAFGAALEAYGVSTLGDLVIKLGGIDQLELVLGFHVVAAVAFADDLSDGAQTFTTLGAQDIIVTKTANGVTVTDAAGTISNVVIADVAIENGVVHVIDGVLLPDLNLPNLVEAATAAGLTTLLEAVTAIDGLATTLLDAEAITVFAPSNAAFTALLAAEEVSDLAGLIEKLGADNVAKVLQFHVVPAVAFASDLQEGNQTVPTLAGEDLTVNKTGAVVTVTDAAGSTYTVTTANVAIANGVVHVIDGVLIPTL
jgi:transforming growth factor-beta-induced protein